MRLSLNSLTYGDLCRLDDRGLRALATLLTRETAERPPIRPGMPFHEWICAARWIRGKSGLRPFSFAGHEFLREICSLEHPYVVLEKAAQMGATEVALSKVLYYCTTLPRFRAIYFFPSDTDVEDFSKDRVDGALRDSPYLAALPSNLKNVGVKQVGCGTIYFRGMFAKRRTKSIPADMVVFDELDEAQPANKAQAKERLSHSAYGYVIELSTPTLPGRGIDIEFQQSDMRFWHVACGCREGIVLEKTFPECIGVRADGTAYLRCPRCGKEDLNPQVPAVVGEYVGWIPDRPEAKARRGYHMSQLFSSVFTTSQLWYEYQYGHNIAEFYNSKLGLPYAGDRMPLTDEDVWAACGDTGLVTAYERVYVGIDVGPHEWYIWVHAKNANTHCRKLLFAEVISARDTNGRPWERAGAIIRQYKKPTVVIDAQPERSMARELCRTFHPRAMMCFYSENQKQKVVCGDPDDPDDGQWKVSAHRTETLDDLVQAIKRGGQGTPTNAMVLLHRDTPVMDEIRRHLVSLAKVRKESYVQSETGRQPIGYGEYVYVDSGADHFAHAANYAMIAEACEPPDAVMEFI